MMIKKRKPRTPLLVRVGKTLYGDVWKQKLARDLRVDKRTVLNWCAAQKPPPHQWPLILELVGSKNLELVNLIREIETAE